MQCSVLLDGPSHISLVQMPGRQTSIAMGAEYYFKDKPGLCQTTYFRSKK